MRRYLTFLAVSLVTAISALAQSTTITATHIAQSLNGTLLPTGQLCLTPVSQAGVPSGFQANGVQYLPQQACFTVTNGAVSGVSVPDTAHVAPSGIGYLVSVTDGNGQTLYNFSQPIYPTGTTWSLDTWSPTQTAVITNAATVSYSVNTPQGRCGTMPALDYTSTTVFACINQIWVPIVSGGGGGGTLTALGIETALGFTPASTTDITNAIAAIPALSSSSVTGALGYTPTSPSDLATGISAWANSTNVDNAIGYVPVSPTQLANAIAAISPTSMVATPGFSVPAGTYTAAQSISLSDATSGAAISYCTNATGNCAPTILYGSAINVAASETICADAVASSGGVISAIACTSYVINTGTPPSSGTGIGTIIAQTYLTDGSVAYKTCYIGSSVCSGGVSGTPSSTPTHTFGLNTPSASTGLSNKVGNFHLETASPKPTFTEALWTTTGGGAGNNPTATNFYVSGWMKVAYAAGQSRIEFDTYAFDSGWDWMFGTQCNADKNLIQTANQSSSWTYTSVPCGMLYDGNYHHVEMTFHRTLGADRSCSSAPCQVWDTVTIDGKSYAVNVTMPATSSTWSGSGWQFQIDGSPTTASSGSPATYDLWMDSAQFIAGTAATGGGSPGGGGVASGGGAGTGDLDSFNFDGGTSIPTGLTTVGSPVISTTQAHTTPNSAHFPSGLNYLVDTISPVSTIYTRQYIYINTENGSLPDTFLRFYHGGTLLWNYFFDTSGHLSYYDQASSTDVVAYSTAFPTGSWHYVETYTSISPTAGHVTIKVDGTQVYDQSGLNTGNTTINTVWFGNIGNTAPTGWDTYEDNVDFDDSNWIGPI